MKIATSLSSERVQGWVSPRDLKAFVSLKTLFGIPAADRRVSAEITLSPTPPRRLLSRSRLLRSPARQALLQRALEDRNTNGKGEAEFDLGLEALREGHL